MEKRGSRCCIAHKFSSVAILNPNKIAVIHASDVSQISRESTDESPASFLKSPPLYDGDKFVTFEELSSSVDSLSSRLRSILDGGDDPFLHNFTFRGDHVCGEAGGQTRTFESNTCTPKVLGIYMPPSVEYVVCMLSVLRCGEAFLPLDPSWPKHRILSIISSSNASLVIACESSFNKKEYQLLDRSHWLLESGMCPVLFFSMEENPGQQISQPSSVWPCEREKQRAFCYVMFTSGSTGKPKGVCGTEQGLLNRYLWMEQSYPMLAKERLLFKTSISFIDHLQEVLGAVLTATTLIIPPFGALKDNPYSILHFLQAYAISRFTAVPSMMKAILPALQNHGNKQILNSLKLVVLSGEVLPVSLWDMLRNLLPNTSILNLYGSTEISGDCTYFDCGKLPNILKVERLSSVPIGMPIFDCDIVLVGDGDKPQEGEIYAGGVCICNGYLHVSNAQSEDYVKMHGNSICNHSSKDCGSRLYFRTGDLGRRLPSGDLVFMGRKDRTIKLNGQRMALEEIEATLRMHPSISDVAVVFHKDQEELFSLEAFIAPKDTSQSIESLKYSTRNWVVDKLPLAMVPNRFILMESLPMSSSGKVDYDSLTGFRSSRTHVQHVICSDETKDTMQVIKKAFCDALVVEEVSDDDDFFAIGGDSLAAAHLSHSLAIDMRLLYKFRSPFKLMLALLEKEFHEEGIMETSDRKVDLGKESANGFDLVDCVAPVNVVVRQKMSRLRSSYDKNGHFSVSKRLKVALENYECPRPEGGDPWNLPFRPIKCSFSRCNRVLYGDEYTRDAYQVTRFMELPRDGTVCMQELWKVHMESCVDASPLIVFKDSDIYLFIGSHAHKFLCVDAKSGSVLWETNLEGRVEGSAAIVGDFSQVVVGCYKGKIYFLDFSSGSICWTFQARGEVKCQPVMDTSWQLIWCGSHDHNLYALDYKKHRCVYEIQCGGSIFGSPAVDENRAIVYVASTSGRVTAVSTKAFPFHILWLLELEVPIFGSLTISSSDGTVICCFVNGHVVALSPTGAIIWKYRTAGPVFAGACMSHVFPSQMLVCSRNGSVYSFESESGSLIWEYNVGGPVSASAYVDENLQFKSDPSLSSYRLVCICSSSGSIHVLRINANLSGNSNESNKEVVQEFAKLALQGDIFSSPLMIGGRIFVGCRDDYLHCISLLQGEHSGRTSLKTEEN